MMKHHPLVVVALLALCILAGSMPEETNAQVARRCFPETGHCIEGRIRQIWEQGGGLAAFGFPLSTLHDELVEGQLRPVQWFERARLELHYNQRRPFDVQISRLGADALQRQGATVPPGAPQQGCRFFPQTAHNVCGAFAAFWESRGLELDGRRGLSDQERLALTGLPLTEAYPQPRADGTVITVQWFERARFELHPDRPAPGVLLGLVGTEQLQALSAPDPASFPLAAQQARDRINHYRTQIGLAPVQLYPALVTAAQAHADYYIRNAHDTSAWAYGSHGEVEGKPGYTGRWPSDRIKAAGYPWFGGDEDMHFLADPIRAVDDWMQTVYHRLPIIDPTVAYVGYGLGKSQGAAVDVLDFGSGPLPLGGGPSPLAYPAHQQTGVERAWDGGESPSPLPPGTDGPVGFPFTLQGVNGALRVDWAELRDASGTVVPTFPNPPDCAAFNCYALIAVRPLRAGTTYIVSARGAVEGVPFDRTWQFTTGR